MAYMLGYSYLDGQCKYSNASCVLADVITGGNRLPILDWPDLIPSHSQYGSREVLA